jgi:hypothetical protein
MPSQWIIYKPGSKYGPCSNQCDHVDCNANKEMSEQRCMKCGAPIGYEREFLVESDGNAIIHNDC